MPASEARENFSAVLDSVELRRVLVTKHGEERAFIVSARELRALEETLAILENTELMNGIARSLADIKAERVEDANSVFAELDADFRDEETGD